MSTHGNLLRQIPPVDQILLRPDFRELLRTYRRPLVLEELQKQLDTLRTTSQAGDGDEAPFQKVLSSLPDLVDKALTRRFSPSLRRVINATGILIHTNAGRSPIGTAVAAAMAELATGYSNLEYQLDQRRRGHRDQHFEPRMKRLVGCEASTICNNNAAAVFLILNTLAEGRNVLVSRGELVEIGGSFRIPSILEKSGALLREVGTTNKTRIGDYHEAIDEQTGLILRVHPSNYKIIGFTQKPPVGELVKLAREHEIPLVEDLGSGLLFDSPHPSLGDEPSVAGTVAEGVDLVCFSGDKLLGGPQAGIIVGRRHLVDKIRKNPLMRALRVDKVTYSAMEHSLICYERDGNPHELPVHRMLQLSASEIRRRAENMQAKLFECGFTTKLAEGYSLTGGGTAPEEHIPTCLLKIRAETDSANDLEEHLRNSPLPVLARIEDDALVLDLRTVFPQEDQVIIDALLSFAGSANPD